MSVILPMKNVPPDLIEYFTSVDLQRQKSIIKVNTKGIGEPHYAAYPEELIKIMVDASVSDVGCCPDCYKPWEPVIEIEQIDDQRWGDKGGRRIADIVHTSESSVFRTGQWNIRRVVGWRPGCSCYDNLYKSELPRTKSNRKRYQQDKADRWFKRARQRPGLDSWGRGKSIILDPFMGSGTTGKVAHDQFQYYIGFDLNPKYVKMAERRIGAKNFMDLIGK